MSEFHADAPQLKTCPRSLRGGYRAGVEPMTLRTKGVVSTNVPHMPHNQHNIIILRLKKSNADPTMHQYWPVAKQRYLYIQQSNQISQLTRQSNWKGCAYNLLRPDDSLRQRSMMLFCLVDFSATSDIFLTTTSSSTHCQQHLGIQGSALLWFRSYQQDHTINSSLHWPLNTSSVHHLWYSINSALDFVLIHLQSPSNLHQLGH